MFTYQLKLRLLLIYHARLLLLLFFYLEGDESELFSPASFCVPFQFACVLHFFLFFPYPILTRTRLFPVSSYILFPIASGGGASCSPNNDNDILHLRNQRGQVLIVLSNSQATKRRLQRMERNAATSTSIIALNNAIVSRAERISLAHNRMMRRKLNSWVKQVKNFLLSSPSSALLQPATQTMLKEPTLLHGHYLCRVRRILRMYIMPTTTLTLNRIEIIIRETLLFILFRTPVMAQKINPKKIKKQPSRPPMRTLHTKKKNGQSRIRTEVGRIRTSSDNHLH